MSQEKTYFEKALEQARIVVSLENTVRTYDRFLIKGTRFGAIESYPRLKEWGEASTQMVGLCRNENLEQNESDADDYVNPKVCRLLLDMSMRGNPHAIRELSSMLQSCIRVDDKLKPFKAAVDGLVTSVAPCGDSDNCANHFRVNFDVISKKFKDYFPRIKLPCVTQALTLPENDLNLRGRDVSSGSSGGRGGERSLSPVSKFALQLEQSQGVRSGGGGQGSGLRNGSSNPMQIPPRVINQGGGGFNFQ